MRFRSLSLRTQLVIMGLSAVVVPLALLLSVVLVTTSSEEDVSGPAVENGTVEFGTTESSGQGEAVLATVVLALLGGAAVWVWSGRALRPVAAITDVANEIQQGSLDRRIGLAGAASEVQALGDSFDRMLDRLSQASATQQQLIEDASHELRTPLTALAVNNEVILEHPGPSLTDYRASVERNEALIARLQHTIDDLLRDARSRSQSTRQVDNDLMAIVRRAVDQHRAANPGVPVVVTGPAELRAGIDGPSVQRALVNLLENAARYTPDGVPIAVDVSASPVPQLSVTDHGPGIESAAADRVFDRYYQSDDGEGGGAGIGLALVKQVADAHEGIEVVSPLPGDDRGTRFTLTFAASPQ